MLSVSRAIIERRDLILIDEPTKGLGPSIIRNMIAAFREIARETTVLLVEQNFHFAKALGQTVAVIDDGRIVHSGRMADLAADTALQSRFLSLSLEAH
jgi:branched-chain amino acid transport system ATP-binding protein